MKSYFCCTICNIQPLNSFNPLNPIYLYELILFMLIVTIYESINFCILGLIVLRATLNLLGITRNVERDN